MISSEAILEERIELLRRRKGGGRYRDCVKMTDDVGHRQKRNSGNVLCIEEWKRADEREDPQRQTDYNE